jgi:type IV secretory pathway TrbF-like protein
MLKALTNPLLSLRGFARRDRATTIPATAKKDSAAAAREVPVHGPLNPYIEARREWNERYGDYIKQAHHWRTVALICALVALIAVVGVVHIGSQGKVVPYVVEVDKLGSVAAIAPAERSTAVDPRVIKAYVARFIADWRSVTIDRQAQKSAIDRVYAMLPNSSVALGKMNDYFKAQNPFTVSATRSVEVAITNLLPLSDKTWQVEWREMTRDLRGELQSNVRMKVSVMVGITPTTDERLILVNPLGVYITDLNWSQQF